MGLIFALHGTKGSGKDEFFKIVKRFFPELDVRKVAYADPIKREVCRIFGISSEEEYDHFKRKEMAFEIVEGTKTSLHGRHFVREVGMLMRRYDVNQFVRYVEDTVKSAPEAVWCITDVRFENELISVRGLDAIVVKILRAGATFDGHVSEVEFPSAACNYVIHNDGNIKEYEYEVVSLIEHVMHYRAPELLKVEG